MITTKPFRYRFPFTIEIRMWKASKEWTGMEKSWHRISLRQFIKWWFRKKCNGWVFCELDGRKNVVVR